MTTQERNLVAALLRCAATSNLHEVIRDLAPLGRLTGAAWEAFYEAGCDAAAAAAALGPPQHEDKERAEVHVLATYIANGCFDGGIGDARALAREVLLLRREVADRDSELHAAQRELADAHEFIRLSSTRAVRQ